MKTIEVNGEKYISEADVKEKLEKTGLNPKYLLLDPYHIMALASCETGEGYYRLTMDLNILEKAIIIFKQLDIDEVTFAFKENFPLVMGIEEKDTNRINGVIIAPIAPRTKDDD
jgi:hypothetical protein